MATDKLTKQTAQAAQDFQIALERILAKEQRKATSAELAQLRMLINTKQPSRLARIMGDK